MEPAYAPLIEELFLLREEIRRVRHEAGTGLDLRAFCDAAGCCIAIAQAGRKIVYLNDPFASSLHRDRGECLGADFLDLLWEGDRERGKVLFSAGVDGASSTGIALRFRDIDGAPVPMQGCLFPVRPRSPDPVLIGIAFLPVTEGRRVSGVPLSRDVEALLTRRELEICRYLRNGLSSKEIAGVLSISTQSVQTHRHHIRRKLGLLNSRANLVSYLKSAESWSDSSL